MSLLGNNDCLISGNTITAPDGFLTGATVNETTATAGHSIFQVFSSAERTNYTMSAFVKKDSMDYVQLTGTTGAFGASQYANYNLNDCSVLVSVKGIATAEQAPNGWCRIRHTVVSTATGNTGSVIGFIPSSTSARLPAYAGNILNGTYMWGLQLEKGDTLTPYNSTSQILLNNTPDNNVPNREVQFYANLPTAGQVAWNWSFTDYGNATIIKTNFSTEQNPTQLFGAGNFSVNHSALVGTTTIYSANKWINISAGRFRQGLEEQNLTGFRYYPTDHIYNTDISGLPVSGNSTLYIGNMSMGSPTSAYLYVTAQVPVIQVDANITKTYPIYVTYPAGSNGTSGIPIPDYTDISVPGAQDDHVVKYIDRDTNTVYSMWGTGAYDDGRTNRFPNGTYHVGSTFQANALSYDIPIDIRNDPPIVRYDEIANGNLTHAIGIAVNCTRNSGTIWPIRFTDGSNTSQWAPPQGTRLRLRQNFEIKNYTPIQQHFLNGLKNYGMIIIDNTGAQSTYWFGGKVIEDNTTLYTELQGNQFNGGNASNPDWVLADDFEIVDESSLMISVSSGQVNTSEPAEPDSIIILIINYFWQFFHLGGRLL